MDLNEQLLGLQKRVLNLKDKIKTEEATKNSLVMPFIQLLGYDIFNPLEVIPEFVADISTKKGEKVDYCIQKDNKPIIIIECKHWSEDLTLHNTQLERYFNCTEAKFGILTNGIKYRIYTDLASPNKLDEKPFLEFDLENLKPTSIDQLVKFHKKNFDVEEIFDSAGVLKYSNEIKEIYNSDLKDPSEDFVRYFAKHVYKNGNLTPKVVEQFKLIVKDTLDQIFKDIIDERLKSALNSVNNPKDEKTDTQGDNAKKPHEIIIFENEKKGIVTTQEEINAFSIVVDILKENTDIDKIVHRDTKNYMGILYNNNNRQPICRLWFNNSNKQIGIFNSEKIEEKFPIQKVEHIYKFADRLKDIAEIYKNNDNKE